MGGWRPGYDWTDTGSQLLLVSFDSDESVTDSGFRIETECRPKSQENPKSKLLQCYESASRIFLQPAPETNRGKNNDFTKCVFEEFYNITDLCDDDACQMPPGYFIG